MDLPLDTQSKNVPVKQFITAVFQISLHNGGSGLL